MRYIFSYLDVPLTTRMEYQSFIKLDMILFKDVIHIQTITEHV